MHKRANGLPLGSVVWELHTRNYGQIMHDGTGSSKLPTMLP
jgi:hypothetical protein